METPALRRISTRIFEVELLPAQRGSRYQTSGWGLFSGVKVMEQDR